MGIPLASRRRLALVSLLAALAALGSAAGAASHAVRDRAAPVPHFAGARAGDFPARYGAPGAIAEVADPTGSGEQALRFTVSNGDVEPLTPTENPRAQLVSPDLVRPGANVWLATKFLVPDDYPEVDPDGWVTLIEIYGAPFDGPSPWRLALAGDSLQWERNATYDFDLPFRQPLSRGRWIDVLLHERFGRHGFVEMWIDGRSVEFFGSRRHSGHSPTRRLRMATRDSSNGAAANSVRIGQYREEGMFAKGTIYFGALEVGPTRDSVASP